MSASQPVYQDDHLQHVAFPLGGIGAGMMCLEGAGSFAHVSLRHKPQIGHEPMMFAAVHVKGASPISRVVEGPVPTRKVLDRPQAGNGLPKTSYGLPRFADARFQSRFPFAEIMLNDPRVPLGVTLTGWSPFIPGDADASSLPVAAVEYQWTNPTPKPIELVFSFHAMNFMALKEAHRAPIEEQGVRPIANGFALWQDSTDDAPAARGAFAAFIDEPDAVSDCAWFRGKWFDPLTMLWRSVEAGACCDRPPHAEAPASPGGSVYLPATVPANGSRTVCLALCWHVPISDVRTGDNVEVCDTAEAHSPWYAGRFADIDAVAEHWRGEYDALRARSRAFTDCFYDTTLPGEVVEAAAANLAILKSPTVLRQRDGRLWAWEGCSDQQGCCPGSCTHVWNYAQALPHLFPDLERTLRETEFGPSQDDAGYQNFRALLPIRPHPDRTLVAAADGQLGGMMKVYREWRISGDHAWLADLWPRVRRGLRYCIDTWDPDHRGVLTEPHHNTYDIEFWGPDGMCSSFYLGALAAAARMGRACGDDGDDVVLFDTLRERGRAYLEKHLFNGEYFEQDVQWKNLRAGDPTDVGAHTLTGAYSPEAIELLQREGPKYQYGAGCLSDGVLGAWMAAVCGLDEALVDPELLASHLRAVHRHNLRHELREHANPQRPGYALGDDGGLLLCTWPRGGKPALPFVYSDEVWTGIEYQVASHLIMTGHIDEGLEIVRTCRRRYDGRVRNPFDEYECGHWYARAMASYALLEACSGARYDAVTRTLHVRPRIAGDLRAFLATATGFGTVVVENGTPRLEVITGEIPVDHIELQPAEQPQRA